MIALAFNHRTAQLKARREDFSRCMLAQLLSSLRQLPQACWRR